MGFLSLTEQFYNKFKRHEFFTIMTKNKALLRKDYFYDESDLKRE